jgi:hypothetical protein
MQKEEFLMKKVLLMTLIALMVGAFVSGGLVQTADAKPVCTDG